MSDLYDRLDWLINNVRAIQVEPKGGHIMSEHTAGPWRMDIPGANSLNTEIGIWSDDKAIASVHPYYMANGEQENNARLIAAAPELLAALETLHVCLTAPLFDRDALDGMYDIAQAAIAKARGVTS